ncbi:MAG: hypothetical protein J6V35_03240 [Bacteroidales bacterium]|nr:hypothetical protein [Bacteroidales bacterium]
MMWYEIVIGIFGALGGLAGIGAFIKAFFFVKQDKEAKTIDNLIKIIDEVKEEYKELKGEFHDYKVEVDKRVTFFKEKFDEIERERDNFKKATMEANRCTLPTTIEECPVVKFLANLEACQDCKKNKNQNN